MKRHQLTVILKIFFISETLLRRILHKIQELKSIDHTMRFRFQRSTYRKCRFWQKKSHLFRWSSFWSWRVCKQAKLSHLGHRKSARINWKADAPKPSYCLVLILVQRYNWAIFSSKINKEWSLRSRAIVTVKGDRYRAMLNEFLFTKIEEQVIGNIWFQQDGALCHTAKATLNVLRPVFEDRIISRRADVVWPPRSCDLTPLDYYLPSKTRVIPTSQRKLTH